MILSKEDQLDVKEYDSLIEQSEKLKDAIEKEILSIIANMKKTNSIRRFNRSQSTFVLRYHSGDWDDYYNIIVKNRKLRKSYGCRRNIGWFGNSYLRIKNAGDYSIFHLLKINLLSFVKSENLQIQNTIDTQKILLESLQNLGGI